MADGEDILLTLYIYLTTNAIPMSGAHPSITSGRHTRIRLLGTVAGGAGPARGAGAHAARARAAPRAAALETCFTGEGIRFREV